MMANLFQTAVSGLNDAVARLTNAATNIVNASSTRASGAVDKSGASSSGFMPQDVVTLSQSVGGQTLGVTSSLKPREGGAVDVASELVDARIASLAYKANAKVIEVARETDSIIRI